MKALSLPTVKLGLLPVCVLLRAVHQKELFGRLHKQPFYTGTRICWGESLGTLTILGAVRSVNLRPASIPLERC